MIEQARRVGEILGEAHDIPIIIIIVTTADGTTISKSSRMQEIKLILPSLNLTSLLRFILVGGKN